MIPALLLLLASPAAPKIAVLDVKARVGVSVELAQGITDALVSEVRKRANGASVIGAEEIRAMVSFVKQKEKINCQDTQCLAELGGALGADLLVIGTLGKFGKTYLLSVQLVQSRTAKVKNEASLKVKSRSEDDLLDAVSRAAEQLFPEGSSLPLVPLVAANLQPVVAPVAAPVPAAPSSQPTPVTAPVAATTAPVPAEVTLETPAKSHLLQWGLIGVGAAAGVVAAIGGIEVLSYVSFNNGLAKNAASGTTTIQTARGQQSTANAWGTTALVLAGVAVACGAGAAITW